MNQLKNLEQVVEVSSANDVNEAEKEFENNDDSSLSKYSKTLPENLIEDKDFDWEIYKWVVLNILT